MSVRAPGQLPILAPRAGDMATIGEVVLRRIRDLHNEDGPSGPPGSHKKNNKGKSKWLHLGAAQAVTHAKAPYELFRAVKDDFAAKTYRGVPFVLDLRSCGIQDINDHVIAVRDENAEAVLAIPRGMEAAVITPLQAEVTQDTFGNAQPKADAAAAEAEAEAEAEAKRKRGRSWRLLFVTIDNELRDVELGHFGVGPTVDSPAPLRGCLLAGWWCQWGGSPTWISDAAGLAELQHIAQQHAYTLVAAAVVGVGRSSRDGKTVAALLEKDGELREVRVDVERLQFVEWRRDSLAKARKRDNLLCNVTEETMRQVYRLTSPSTTPAASTTTTTTTTTTTATSVTPAVSTAPTTVTPTPQSHHTPTPTAIPGQPPQDLDHLSLEELIAIALADMESVTPDVTAPPGKKTMTMMADAPFEISEEFCTLDEAFVPALTDMVDLSHLEVPEERPAKRQRPAERRR